MVHGYREGHRLLASSLSLPDEEQHELTAISDAGDVDAAIGFPTLLSGMPLRKAGLYVFTKTWPAVEVRRPGAVWSHSILVPFRDLRDVTSSMLVSAFRRPEAGAHISYSLPLLMEPRDEVISEVPNVLPVMLWALYESPFKPVCVVLEELDSASRQHVLIRILLQQWPAEHQHFTFAEAPAWERRFQDRVFDLLATTSVGAAAIAQGSKDIRIIRANSRATAPTWAHIGAQQISQDSGLASFLYEFGDDVALERATFALLTNIWELVGRPKGRTSVTMALQVLDNDLPSPNSGRKLKRRLFGAPGRPSLFQVSEQTIIETLCREEFARCLPVMDLGLTIRARQVWSNNRSGHRLLATAASGKGPEEVRTQVLEGLISAMNSADLISVMSSDRRVLRKVIAIKPELLLDERLWRESDASETLLRSLATIRLKDATKKRLLKTILTNASPIMAPDLVSIWPWSVGPILESAVDDRPGKGWAEAVPTVALLDYLIKNEVSPKGLLSAAERFDRHELSAIPPDRWLPCLELLRDDDATIHQRALAFMLSTALRSSQPPWDEVAVQAFWRIHRLAFKNQLEDRLATEELQDVAKGAEPWDIAKGIAISTSDAFNRWDQWRPSLVAEIPDREAFSALLSFDAQDHHGSNLLIRLARDSSSLQLNEWQLEEITRLLAKTAKKGMLLEILEALLRRYLR
jgi:hypothetical protein